MSITSLAQLSQLMAAHQPLKPWYRALTQRAVVALILAEHPELGLAFLMIQRAEYDGDRWSGQMGFPGGKHDSLDANMRATVERELIEELGLDASQLQCMGRLSDIVARPHQWDKKPMIITPLVFSASSDVSLTPNAEVAACLWLPVSHFQNANNRQMMPLTRAGITLELPCYVYQKRRIWGLSLLMIDELLQL